MFKKKRHKKEVYSPANDVSPEAVASTPSLTRTSNEEATIIKPHSHLEGSIGGRENLEIEGSVIGRVDLPKHKIYIRQKGRAEGEFIARSIHICGEMKGSIEAVDRVEIFKDADFFGQIKAKSISIEDGSMFKGAIELYREPESNGDIRQTSNKDATPSANTSVDALSSEKSKGT
jgi:cytoskeletal protein CcmA (bactofilin family)